MAPTMEQLGRHVAEWRASLLDEGLKGNVGKSKVMVGSNSGKFIVNSESFCYMGSTLDGYGGADPAATARIRNGWMKFWEILPFLTSRAPPLEMKGRVYARPLLADVGLKFERAEMQMIRWMCGETKDRRTSEYF